MKSRILFMAPMAFLLSCSSQTSIKEKTTTKSSPDTGKVDSSKISNPSTPAPSGPVADAATILSRKQVPVLCYHHIRETYMSKGANRAYEVTIQQFKEHMKALADSGYHSVSPEQIYNYLAFGTPLPEKPVMISFDDTDVEQFTVAKPEMDKYGFKGVYFIMSISIGRPHYMSKEQIRQLSDEGHVIACHTWDHSRTDRYIAAEHIDPKTGRKLANDWDVQLTNTKKKLEDITGKPVDYFAYPYGVWSPAGIPEIKKRGFKMAFELSTKRDSLDPLYTVRRIIVSPDLGTTGLIKSMQNAFK